MMFGIRSPLSEANAPGIIMAHGKNLDNLFHNISCFKGMIGSLSILLGTSIMCGPHSVVQYIKM